MAAKKDTKIENDAPVAEQQTEAGEGDVPAFAFPADFYGNEWDTVADKMLYWAKYVEGPFVYGTDVHEEGSWAVCSDDGGKSVISEDEFNERFVPVPAPAGREPAYIAAEKEAADQKAAEKEAASK